MINFERLAGKNEVSRDHNKNSKIEHILSCIREYVLIFSRNKILKND